MDWTVWISGLLVGGVGGTIGGVFLAGWAIGTACKKTGRLDVAYALMSVFEEYQNSDD